MDSPEVPEPGDPAQIRIADADRHQVSEALRKAAGEGRLDLEELDERLEATYAAKVYGDLVPILADLPDQVPQLPQTRPEVRRPAAPTGPLTTYDSSVIVMGGVTRKGVWQVGETHTAFALMGGVDMDLREAVFTAAETVISANTIMGGVDIVVNARTQVIVDGIGIMGDFSQGRDRVEPEFDETSPVVRVKGFALMGAVTVLRKRMPGEPRSKRLRRR